MKLSGAVPFQVGGVAEAAHFTDRADEVARIATVLRRPGQRLLVYGTRRMGKTSAIRAAITRVSRARPKAHVAFADLSTATTPADVANRVAAGIAAALGRRWQDWAADFAAHIGLKLILQTDPVTGVLTPSLELGLRRAAQQEQLDALGKTLDAAEQLAISRKTNLSLVLDEFQELSRMGGAESEWHLRGHMQHHKQLTYVVSGSQEHLIRQMLERDRAFYKMFDLLHFGPMDEAHLGRWIEERMASAGVKGKGTGAAIVQLARQRTQDILQLAAKTWELSRAAGVVNTTRIGDAFEQIVRAEADLVRALWEDLTPLQQNVLRAVAVKPEGLTTSETIDQFSLASTGSATNAARALIDKGILERDSTGGYSFDSPYVRGWVLLHAIADLGFSPMLPWRAINLIP